MPKLTMLADAKGAPQGHTTHDYTAGKTYDLPHPMMPDDLAAAFVAMGVAEIEADVTVADNTDVADPDAASVSAPVVEDAPKPKRTRKPKA